MNKGCNAFQKVQRHSSLNYWGLNVGGNFDPIILAYIISRMFKKSIESIEMDQQDFCNSPNPLTEHFTQLQQYGQFFKKFI